MKEDNGAMEGSDDCVKVAVNIRPLITAELLNGSTDCVIVTPGEPQVKSRHRSFNFLALFFFLNLAMV